MPNDRELLELAAKAAGIGPVIGSEDDSTLLIGPRHYIRRWAPLTDDGDALRLAVKCQIMVFPPKEGFAAACTDRDEVDEWEEVLVGDDPCAATRRAIVRAAAEIGRGMP